MAILALAQAEESALSKASMIALLALDMIRADSVVIALRLFMHDCVTISSNFGLFYQRLAVSRVTASFSATALGL